jgi:hypothetical protein
MTTQLRPLSLAEILDRIAELYRGHFVLFAGIAAPISAAMLLVQMLHLGALNALGYPRMEPGMLWASGVAGVVEGFLILLIGGVAIAANNRAVAWVHLGEPASIGGAYRSIVPRLRRICWLMSVVFLRAWLPLSLLYVAMMGLTFSMLPAGIFTHPGAHVAPMEPTQAFHFLAGVLVLLPLLFAATFYGVLMSLRYSLAMPACVVEGLTAGQALKRSVQLSKESRGRIFVLWLLVFAIKFGIGLLLSLPVMVFTVQHLGQPLPLFWMVVSQIGGFLVNLFIGPIWATGLTLFYYDQRVRKEGFDIVWMMQAAGLEAPAAESAAAAPTAHSEAAAAPETLGEP